MWEFFGKEPKVFVVSDKLLEGYERALLAYLRPRYTTLGRSLSFLNLQAQEISRADLQDIIDLDVADCIPGRATWQASDACL